MAQEARIPWPVSLKVRLEGVEGGVLSLMALMGPALALRASWPLACLMLETPYSYVPSWSGRSLMVVLVGYILLVR